jgi:hypothetical protein
MLTRKGFIGNALAALGFTALPGGFPLAASGSALSSIWIQRRRVSLFNLRQLLVWILSSVEMTIAVCPQ